MLFPTIPLFLKRFWVFLVLKGLRWNLSPHSHAVCSTQHIVVCHTPALPGGSLSWEPTANKNPYFTVVLNHCTVLSKKGTHFLLQLKTSPPKSWPRCRWGHMLRGWLKLKPALFLFAASAHSCVSAGHLWSCLNWEWLFEGSLQIIPAHLTLLSKTGNKRKPHAGPLSLYSFYVSGPTEGPEVGSTSAPQHLGHPSWLKKPLHGFHSWILAHSIPEHVYAETCIAMQLLFQGYQKLYRYDSKGFHIFLHPL